MLKYLGTRGGDATGSEVVSEAEIALKHLTQANDVLERAFNNEKKGRLGTSSDEEQDILRARLVLSSAGMDSVLKYLCYRAIPYMVNRNDEIVSKRMKEHLSDILKKAFDNPREQHENRDIITEILLSNIPMEEVIKQYINTHFNGSMQSYDALMKVMNLLNIDTNHIKEHESELRDIFQARNEIIHELDMDPFGSRRKRIQRRVRDIDKMCRLLKKVASTTIEKVIERIDSIS